MNRLLIIAIALVAIVVGVGSWKGQVQNPLPPDRRPTLEQVPEVNQPPTLRQMTVFDDQGRPYTVTVAPSPGMLVPGTTGVAIPGAVAPAPLLPAVPGTVVPMPVTPKPAPVKRPVLPPPGVV